MQSNFIKNFISFIACACFLMLTNVSNVIAQLNGNYTINAAVATGGTNYQSFTALANALQTQGVSGPVNVNVVANSGPYTEIVEFGNIPNASATNRITINGNNNTLQFNNTINNYRILTLNGTKYMKIQNLTIKSQNATYGWGIHMYNNAQFDTIVNCHLDLSSITGSSSTYGNGFVISASTTSPTTSGVTATDIYFANNTISGSSTSMYGIYYAISVMGLNTNGGANNIHIVNNEIKNFYYYGIRLYYVNDAIVKGNLIHKSDKTTTPTTMYAVYGYYMIDCEFEGNKIYKPNGSGVGSYSFYGLYLVYGNYYGGNKEFKVVNNAIYGNTSHGSTNYPLYLSSNRESIIAHNTVDYTSTIASSGTIYGIYISPSQNNDVRVLNNNVTITGGTTGTKYGMYLGGNIDRQNVAGNNVYVASTQTGTQYYGYYNGTWTTFAAAQTANYHFGPVSVNPNYTNVGTGNLLPTNTLLAGKGVTLINEVSKDITNSNRNFFPTPGAWEMPSPAGYNVAITEIVSPNQFCSGSVQASIKVANASSTTVNYLKIKTKLNTIPQPDVIYTNPIAPNQVVTIPLGTYALATNTPYTFEFEVTEPNNGVDYDLSNNIMTTSVQSALSGIVTVNPGSPASTTNFTSLSSLATRLNQFGVCGPLVVNVNGTSTFNEQFKLKDIPGTSNVNTITINGNGATINYNNTLSTDLGVVVFNATKYTKFDNFKIYPTNVNYGIGILVTGGAMYDTFTNCFISHENKTSTNSYLAGIAFTGAESSPTTSGVSGSYCYVAHNVVKGSTTNSMYYGITISGSSNTGAGCVGNVVEHNEIADFYYYGLRFYNTLDCDIQYNRIHKANKTVANVTTYSTYGYYNNGINYIGNRIYNMSLDSSIVSTSTLYGHYLYYTNYYNQTAKRSVIANNAIYNMYTHPSIYAFYTYYSYNTEMSHNTADLDGDFPTSSSVQRAYYSYNYPGLNDFKNNIGTIARGTTGSKHIFYHGYNGGMNAGGLQGNMGYFEPVGLNGTSNNWGYWGADFATLAAFQAAQPTFEINSLSLDPLYMDKANDSYVPTEPTLLFSGENLTAVIPQDIDKYSRPNPPTPGAFEMLPEWWNNAGVESLNSPLGTFCSGYRSVQAKIENAGKNDITYLEIHWSVNGQIQPPVYYNSQLDGTITSNNNTANVTLGTAFIPYGYPSQIKIWTAKPNNEDDRFNSNDTLITYVNPTSTLPVNIGPDTTICDGVVYNLNAGDPTQLNFDYEWDNASTLYNRDVTTAGNYWVIKTNKNTQCSGHDTAKILINPTPIVNLGADTGLCTGDTLSLNVGNHNFGNNIVWDNNSNDSVRKVFNPGTYSVTVTNSYGCSAYDEIVVGNREQPYSDGINAVYMLNATYNFSLLNPVFVDMAIWDFGDGSPVDTGFLVSHQYATNGFYHVKVKMISNCNVDSFTVYSETLDAIGLGVNDNKLISGLDVYPNPAVDKITISMRDGIKINDLQVYNVIGQIVYTAQNVKQSSHEIDTKKFASGIYQVKVETNSGTKIVKFEVIK